MMFSFEAFELCDSFASFDDDVDVDAGCVLCALFESVLLEVNSTGRDTILICVVVGVVLLASELSLSFGFNKIRGLSGTHLSSLSLFFARIIGRFSSYAQKKPEMKICNFRTMCEISMEFYLILIGFSVAFIFRHRCVYDLHNLIDIVSMDCQTWQCVNVIWISC